MISDEQHDMLQSLGIEYSSLSKRQQEYISKIFILAQSKINQSKECLNVLKESQLSVSIFADMLSIDRTTLYTKKNKPILSVISSILAKQRELNPYDEIKKLREHIEDDERIIDNLRERDAAFIDCQNRITDLEHENEGLLQQLSFMYNNPKKRNTKPNIYLLQKNTKKRNTEK